MSGKNKQIKKFYVLVANTWLAKFWNLVQHSLWDLFPVCEFVGKKK